MKFKGVTYDVGNVMDGNWRPLFDMKVVHRGASNTNRGYCC